MFETCWHLAQKTSYITRDLRGERKRNSRGCSNPRGSFWMVFDISVTIVIIPVYICKHTKRRTEMLWFRVLFLHIVGLVLLHVCYYTRNLYIYLYIFVIRLLWDSNPPSLAVWTRHGQFQWCSTFRILQTDNAERLHKSLIHCFLGFELPLSLHMHHVSAHDTIVDAVVRQQVGKDALNLITLKS